MLQLGQTGKIAFVVNVMGSSIEPMVRVAVNTFPEIAAYAKRDGDNWEALLPIPASFSAGEYELRIEVILNNRLFTPLRKQVMIDVPETVSAAFMEPVVVPEPQVPQVDVPSAALDVPQVEPETVVPDEIEIKISPVGKPSLLQLVADVAPAKVAEPEKIEEAAPPEIIQPVEEIVVPVVEEVIPPKVEAKVEAPKPRLTIAELSRSAGNRPVEIKKSTKKLVEISQRAPVRLVKGTVIFE